MKNKITNSELTAVSLAVAVFTSGVSAHTSTGSLGTAAGATDVYAVVCNTGTVRLDTRVRATDPGSSLISVQTAKLNGSVYTGTNSTDPTGGDTSYSPWRSNNGGTGTYFMLVDHTAAVGAAQPYSVEYHCMNSVNSEVTGSGTLKQNQ